MPLEKCHYGQCSLSHPPCPECGFWAQDFDDRFDLRVSVEQTSITMPAEDIPAMLAVEGHSVRR